MESSRRFDCLSPSCPLFGPHLLEASAGTGKTFSIEHIFLRLVLESRMDRPIEAEQILVVTFTRAATRELKGRIRSNFEKALLFLRSKNRSEAWDYLKPYIDSQTEDAIRCLEEALSNFDRSQIFTIHVFCWRMLGEFAFEAKEDFSLPDPDGAASVKLRQRLKQGIQDFLQYGIEERILCPEQAALLLKKYPSLTEVGKRLIHGEKTEGYSFFEYHQACKAALQRWSGPPIEKKKLQEDFFALKTNFKAEKGDMEAQVAALAELFVDPENPTAFRILLKENGTIFKFLDPANRKIKATPPGFLHYPGFFEWAKKSFEGPIGLARKKILPSLQALWNPIEERLLSEEASGDPDKILDKMKQAIERKPFVDAVRKKYAAVIIDEFQDTDAIQWEIFRRLFLETDLYREGIKNRQIDQEGSLDFLDRTSGIFKDKTRREDEKYEAADAKKMSGGHFLRVAGEHCERARREPTQVRSDSSIASGVRALYFVGDPKQSIYRFRRADVYIYLQARDLLERDHLYHLDTNFRSSKSMVSALNALFQRDWLHLPQIGRTLPYLPVQSGSAADSSFPDQKGSVHFLLAEGGRKEAFETKFLPFASDEIERLLTEVKNESSFALLVKDRFQAAKALDFLRKRGIPAVARSRTSLADTFAFETIKELFAALLNPSDSSAEKRILAGPLGGSDVELPLSEWKEIVEEKGIVAFCNLFLSYPILGNSILERILSYDLSFYRDFLQVFEILFDWERKEGFSFQGLQAFFKQMEEDQEATGPFQRRMETDEKAVQIMTLHASKGLEFEIVFALGLSSETPENEEEAEEFNAEKLRQLYVAMTRAKRRLYVPAILSEKEASLSAQSPIDLFCKHLDSSLPDFLQLLSQKESITFEKLDGTYAGLVRKAEEPPILSFIPSHVSYQTSNLLSFTSLAQTYNELSASPISSPDYNLHTLPRGTETGIVIHSLFEKIFSLPDRKDESAIQLLVEEELRFSPLDPWKESILDMVKRTLSMPLQTRDAIFSLADLKTTDMQVEMEFLFHSPPHFVKGFVDLVFFHNGKFYFLDWKTNWLGDQNGLYDSSSLDAAMKAHDYYLQAALYAEALKRHLKAGDRFEEIFGGAFYFFIRGGVVHHFIPDLKELHGKFN